MRQVRTCSLRQLLVFITRERFARSLNNQQTVLTTPYIGDPLPNLDLVPKQLQAHIQPSIASLLFQLLQEQPLEYRRQP